MRLWSQGLGQSAWQESTNCWQDCKDNHDGKSAVDAGVDDDGSNSDGDSSHSSNKSSSQNSDLSWVQLIEIDVEIGVFEWNGKSEEKYEYKYSNTVSNIDLLVSLALFPDED